MEDGDEFAEVAGAGEGGDEEVVGGSGDGAGEELEPCGGDVVDEYGDDGPHAEGVEECGDEVAHLAQEAYVDEASGVVGVDDEGEEGGDDEADAHGGEAHGDGDAEDGDADDFFVDLEAEEEVAAAFDLEEVEVDGVDGVPHHGEAEDGEEGGGVGPGGVEDGEDEWGGEG